MLLSCIKYKRRLVYWTARSKSTCNAFIWSKIHPTRLLKIWQEHLKKSLFCVHFLVFWSRSSAILNKSLKWLVDFKKICKSMPLKSKGRAIGLKTPYSSTHSFTHINRQVMKGFTGYTEWIDLSMYTILYYKDYKLCMAKMLICYIE